VGEDGLDGELSESGAHLGGVLLSGELLFEGPVAVATPQGTVAVLVDALGDAGRQENAFQQA
jgi:hypothetical protein